MARRDTYHDYVSEAELEEAGPVHAPALLQRRVGDLIDRSGASRVRNGSVTTFYDIAEMTYHMRVGFDSRAWTGR